MNAERLLAHYESIAEAPDAINRLRSFILDLTVRGKLVPQDPDDEPASELLKRIAKEKARLVKIGDARKSEIEPMGSAEAPFLVPVNWAWTRLGSVGDWGSGSTPPRGNSEYYGGDITWLKSGELNDNRQLYGSEETLTQVAVEKGSFRLNRPGDVLIAMYGATIGKVAILAENAVTNQAVCGCTPFAGVFNQFLFLFLLSQRKRFQSASEGGAQPNISKVKIIRTPFPLPPHAEQHRIVAKVNELMALCNRLEAARKEQDSARDRFTTASLARLNTPNPEAFKADARFALDALPALTARLDQIKQLRQTILNLAVRGKLVPQDPNDELADISADNNDREGRLDIDLPSRWRWVQLEQVASARLGKMLDKAKNRGRPYHYLRNTNVHWFKIRLDDLKTIALEDDEVDDFRLEKGDVLICEGGHGIGRTAVWSGVKNDLVFQKALHRVRPGPHLDSYFFAECCFVYFHAGIMQTYFTGVGIPHFTGKALGKLIFPLPPLAEQRRIVAKVDELMALCDRLESSLAAAMDLRQGLLDALLIEALAPAEVRARLAAE
jgi:type I restriction enzyme S subunit